MKSRALAAGIVLTLLVGAAFLFRSRSRTDGTAPDAEHPLGEVAALEPASKAIDESDPTRPLEAPSVPEGERTELARVALDTASSVPPASEAPVTDELVVRVVDETGAPFADVSVALVTAPSSGTELGLRRVSGPDGTARLRGVRAAVSRARDETWFVEAFALVDPRARVELDPAELPAEVTLVVSRCGAVEVRLFDVLGEVAPDGWCRIGIVRPGQERQLPMYSLERRDYLSRAVANGVARFPLVALGAELEVSASGPGGGASTSLFAAGPTRTGETLTFDLRLGADHPVVIVRVVNEAGVPVRDETLELRVDYGGSASTRTVETDREGRLFIDLQNEAKAEIRLERDEPRATASLEIAGDLPPGPTFLGNVVLSASAALPLEAAIDASNAETLEPPEPPLLAGEHTHRVTIRSGEPGFLRGTLHHGPPGADPLASMLPFMGTGSASVTVTGPAEELDLEVHAPGYRVERRERVRGEIDIRLRTGLRVRLVLGGEADLPEPPLVVKAVIVPVGTMKDPMLHQSTPGFDAQREAVVLVSEPGPMQVYWVIQKRSSGGNRTVEVRLERQQVVQVLDVEGEQRIEVTLTREEMEQIVGAVAEPFQ